MQVNPDIEYNEEDAGLALDSNNAIELSEAVETSETQDEADLAAAEKLQKPGKNTTLSGSQVISSPRQVMQVRKYSDRTILATSIISGILAIVAIYYILIFY